MADEDFISALDGADERITAALPAIMTKAMEHVRTVVASLTPVGETGNLVGSEDVTTTTPEGDGGFVSELYIPGPYARRQHYELDYRHTVGQALYLEQPMVTEAGKVFEIIAEGIGDVL
jgi:hypothetical protein